MQILYNGRIFLLEKLGIIILEVIMLELYVLESCPYCKKVIDFFNDNCIEYLKNDVTNPLFKAELIKLGGKEQVPFLYDTEKEITMYESDDIVDYIKNNFL